MSESIALRDKIFFLISPVSENMVQAQFADLT